MSVKAKKEKPYDIVYNIYEFTTDFYLLNAYVVSKDNSGYFAHIKQKATKSTIQAYGLELEPVKERLFEINDLLQPQEVARKFKPARRKKFKLEDLLKDRDVSRSIKRYTHRLINESLSLIVNHDLPVSWDVERKVLVKDFMMGVHKKPLRPHLFFKKTEENVKYRFRLSDETGRWAIHQREVIPITNHPAWVFVDFTLHRIDHVNGNMVKPFQKKTEVIIPNSYVKSYFEKFILKVASKVDIDVQGFDLLEMDQLYGCELHLVNDFMVGQWGIFPKMIYHNTTFGWNEKEDQKTSLNFSDDDNVEIVKIIRDRRGEKTWIDKLSELGLTQKEGKVFVAKREEERNAQEKKGGLDEFELYHWLMDNKARLEKAGFVVKNPVFEEKPLTLNKAELNIGLNQGNDWFDLHGEVVIGEFKIPFVDFAKHIRDNNRFFLLPNGQLFIIPMEWMKKYESLFKFGKKQSGKLQLAKSQFTLLNEIEGLSTEIEVDPEEDFEFEVSEKLKATLRPYQYEGVKWLVRHNLNELGACLADDMGLGKTLQTIAVLLFAKENRVAKTAPDHSKNGQQLDLFQPTEDSEWLNALNALIILPASLVFNWEKEIKQFAPSLSVYSHTGSRRHKDTRIISRFDVILTTYQTVLRDIELMSKLEYEYIVLDESQQIKNKDSKIFKSINRLLSRHKISLSGTPIENSLSDLWAQMHFINPNLLGGYSFFKREFIVPIERKQDEEKKARLSNLVEPYLLRRTKEEVAKDLPPLTVRVFYSEMSREQKKIYDKEKSAARNYLLENFDAKDGKSHMMVMQSLTKLRQLANHPKLIFDAYDKDSSKFLDVWEQWDVVKRGGHKVLMFSSSVKFLNLFRKEFTKKKEPFSWLTGDLSSKEREKEIYKFENNAEISSFLISIKAGGTGLNLVGADYVFILDPWWNPFIEQQAIARAHRIGQDKSVIAFKFITKDTIEEKILRLQRKKTKLANDIIERVGKASFSKTELEYLLD